MSKAKARAAEVLLRGVGGRSVWLRMPSPAVAGDDGEQVGLAVPQFQDLELAPVVFRKIRAKIGTEAVEYELLVSARAVERLVGSLAYESAAVLFRETLGVVVDDALLQVNGVTAAQAFGETYLYRVAVRGAGALLA